MRYWQDRKGTVVTFSDEASPSTDPSWCFGSPWTEVTVTPKPQPKTWTKKVALFTAGARGTIRSLTEEEFQSCHFRCWKQVTDWVEVTFTESMEK
jgi:hypothetical protein